MTAIVTFTLNPALDIAAATDAVVPTDKLRCGSPRYDPGGGGVNVARVVKVLGGKAHAVFPAGGPSGAMLQELLRRTGVSYDVVPIEGSTRASFTVDERRSGLQYRFVLPGPELAPAEREACLDRLAEAARQARYVVASGSVPPGIQPSFFARVVSIVRERDARLILDTSGDMLRAAGAGIYLMKPNLRELRNLVGRELPDEVTQVAAARELIDRGVTEVVVLSLGAKGAVLVTADESERLQPVDVPVRSAVGAGDSMVGGITLGLARGLPLRRAVRLGMAAGAATVMTPGTELCRREDVERLYAALIRGEAGGGDEFEDAGGGAL